MPAPRYTPPAIALHWLIALLIFAGWAIGYYMTGLKLSPQKLQLVSYHKWIGITVLVLACLRAAWRATHTPPPPNPAHPAWQHRAAALGHFGLYVLMLALPVSGWLFSSASGYTVVWFGVIPLPNLLEKDKAVAKILGEAHGIMAWALAALVVVHVGAALYHHFHHRDGILHRMLPRLSSRPAP